jgi:hypothetical protein
MHYALLIYLPEDIEQRITPAQDQVVMDKCIALAQETRKAGTYKGSARLEPTRTAVCVRNREGGRQMFTDGPFAETKEHMVGFYLIDVADLDAAKAYAQKLPTAELGATIEIRPILWQDPAMTLATPLPPEL